MLSIVNSNPILANKLPFFADLFSFVIYKEFKVNESVKRTHNTSRTPAAFFSGT